jgi:hypothetical protein
VDDLGPPEGSDEQTTDMSFDNGDTMSVTLYIVTPPGQDPFDRSGYPALDPATDVNGKHWINPDGSITGVLVTYNKPFPGLATVITVTVGADGSTTATRVIKRFVP